MSRQVVTSRDIAAAGAGPPGGPAPLADMGGPMVAPAPVSDNYTGRLVKYIPSEVIAVYLTMTGILATQEAPPVGLSVGIFLLMLALTPVYLSRMEGVKKKQLALSTLCFLVWAFALGQPPFNLLNIDPIYAALILPLFTFTLPLWDGRA